jgi:hypothetical protein
MQELIEKGWQQVKEGAVDKIENFLISGDSASPFTSKEYMKYYS